MDFVYKRPLNKTKITIILLFLISLIKTDSNIPDISIIENINPICFKMNNGNYLILNQNGLYITDSTFSSIINAHNFECTIKTSDLYTTEISQFSKEDGENILVFVQYYLYLLSKEGKYINDFNLASKINITNHYILLTNKKFSNYLHYAIFYIYSDKITINNFYIKPDGSENLLIITQSYKPTFDSFDNLSLRRDALSCNHMNSSKYGKITLCFFFFL